MSRGLAVLPSFILSFADGRWRCVHLLNMCTHVCVPVFRSLGGRTRSAVAGPCCHPVFDLLRNQQTVCRHSCPVFCSPQREGSDFFIRFFLALCFPEGGTEVNGPFHSSFPSHLASCGISSRSHNSSEPQFPHPYNR